MHLRQFPPSMLGPYLYMPLPRLRFGQASNFGKAEGRGKNLLTLWSFQRAARLSELGCLGWSRRRARGEEMKFGMLKATSLCSLRRVVQDTVFMETGFGGRTPRGRLSLPLWMMWYRATIYCPSLLFPMPSPPARKTSLNTSGNP